MPKVANQGGGGGYRELGPQAPLIAASAVAHGLDPRVALAVAHGEGGFNHAKPGDNNTSFGPFQLHEGGALPSVYDGRPKQADKWANSPAGIDYAVGRLASVTRGLQGQAAIDAGVRNFERPANPNPEIRRDTQFYNQLASGNTPTNPQAAGGSGASANISQGASPGVAPGTVPNVFANCQGTGTLFGIIPYPSPGGIACYAIGMAKVSMFAIGGLVVMGVGFYLMLPRGRQNPISKDGVKDVIGTGITNVATTGNVLKSPRIASTRRVQQNQAEDIRLRQANLAQRTERLQRQSTRDVEMKEYEAGVRRAKLSRERAIARSSREEARQAKIRRVQLEQGPAPFLSPAEEMRIANVKPRKTRPDRVKG